MRPHANEQLQGTQIQMFRHIYIEHSHARPDAHANTLEGGL